MARLAPTYSISNEDCVSDQRITINELSELGRRDADVLIGMMLPSINETKGDLSPDWIDAAVTIFDAEVKKTIHRMFECGLRYGEIRKYHRALKRRFDERLAETFAPYMPKAT